MELRGPAPPNELALFGGFGRGFKHVEHQRVAAQARRGSARALRAHERALLYSDGSRPAPSQRDCTRCAASVAWPESLAARGPQPKPSSFLRSSAVGSGSSVSLITGKFFDFSVLILSHG